MTKGAGKMNSDDRLFWFGVMLGLVGAMVLL